jgi:hypothetical protein
MRSGTITGAGGAAGTGGGGGGGGVRQAPSASKPVSNSHRIPAAQVLRAAAERLKLISSYDARAAAAA